MIKISREEYAQKFGNQAVSQQPIKISREAYAEKFGDYSPGMSQADYLKGTAGNILPSAGKLALGMGEAVANSFNPDLSKNTLANVGRLGMGAIQKLDPTQGKLIAKATSFGSPIKAYDEAKGVSTDYQPQAEAVGKFYKDRYGGVNNIKKTLYEDPTGVALDAVTVLSGAGGLVKGAGTLSKSARIAQIGRGIETAGEVINPLSYAGKAAGKVSSSLKIEQRLGTFGKQVEQAAKDYALRGLRPSQSMITKFKKITGMNLEDYIKKNNLYGNDVAMAEENVARFLEPFDAKTLRTDVDVPITDILNGYDKRIAELSRSGIDDPVAAGQANKLRSQRQSLVDGYYTKKPTGTGSYALKPKVKSRTLKDIVETRRGIDKNTPKSDFGQSIADAGAQRKIGDIYRELQYKYGGKAVKELGKELQKAYEFKNIVEKAPKGKGTLPASLSKGIFGIALNNPIVGAIAESIINSPRTIGAMSKSGQSLGRLIQKTSKAKLPKTNIFSKLVKGAQINRMINPK